jgi:hypothetical protein
MNPKTETAGMEYPLGFSSEGLVMRLRMCAADECHEDEWLSAVMNQAADEIERLTKLCPNTPTQGAKIE